MPAPTNHTPADDNNGNVTPLHRHSARRHGEVTVERIETAPMPPEHYRRAVTALATLINEWKYSTENHPDTGEKAA